MALVGLGLRERHSMTYSDNVIALVQRDDAYHRYLKTLFIVDLYYMDRLLLSDHYQKLFKRKYALADT